MLQLSQIHENTFKIRCEEKGICEACICYAKGSFFYHSLFHKNSSGTHQSTNATREWIIDSCFDKKGNFLVHKECAEAMKLGVYIFIFFLINTFCTFTNKYYLHS